MSRRLSPARLLLHDRGVSAVEFGLVALIMLVLVLGVLELGYQSYARAVLEGAVQEAGRFGARDRAAQPDGDRRAGHRPDHRARARRRGPLRTRQLY